jgi:mannitol-1-phosphate 5-dehydrogenase
MKKAIQFGAGNIGRGFIGAVLSEAGYHVVFADVNELVVNKINEDGKYTVAIMDTECTEQVITNISAVDSRSPELAKEIAQAQVVTTAVGLGILPRIAGALAAGVAERQAQGVTEYLNVIACENGLRASSQLKDHVYSHLTDEQKAYADEYVAFPDCSVDRIVPPIKSENPIDVVVEKFYEWNVERASIKGDLQMEGMNLADNLIAYIERKLFTLNTGHAITAYIGKLKGLSTIADSIADEEIYTIVKAAMQESGEGLVAKYGFDHNAHFAYIDKIIGRFRNPHLQDDVTRVGREPLRKLSANDRLIKPTMTAIEHGFATPNLVLGIGAALHYNNPEDPQSVQLQQAISEVGVAKAFEQFSGVPADSELAAQVLAAYDSWM